MVRLAWSMHLSCVKSSTISKMDQNELPLERCHLGVPSGKSKTITVPMIHLAQAFHLSCTNTNTVSKWTKTRFDMTYITWGFHRVRPKWFLSLWYVRHKQCSYLASRLAPFQMDRNALPLEPHHLRVPSGASKMISEPMVCLAQTVHLSCTDINTVFKWTETRFDMTHVT
jgi:hypothetical protein